MKCPFKYTYNQSIYQAVTGACVEKDCSVWNESVGMCSIKFMSYPDAFKENFLVNKLNDLLKGDK